MKIGERFGPHPNLRKLYFIYLGLAALVPLAISILVPVLVHAHAPSVWSNAWPFLFIPLIIVIAVIMFISHWIGRYCRSISFTLTEEEIIVEHGVWWKFRHTVPYARVMSVDTLQGPISRKLRIGRVDIYTAGYTGVAGGSAGPGTKRAEASIWGVENFAELRDAILARVRGRPLFGRGLDISAEVLEELRRIRRILERR
jgi:membrane protein YdbS with pleckstrin-like domain